MLIQYNNLTIIEVSSREQLKDVLLDKNLDDKDHECIYTIGITIETYFDEEKEQRVFHILKNDYDSNLYSIDVEEVLDYFFPKKGLQKKH